MFSVFFFCPCRFCAFRLSFTASFVSGYDVLVNEDKTRSFVCLRVRGGRQMVLSLIAKVDPLMRRFKQSEYYEVIVMDEGDRTTSLSLYAPANFRRPFLSTH